MPTSRSYHSYLIESLKNPQEAAAYLEAVIEDCEYDELLSVLRGVAEAKLAAFESSRTASNQEILQKILSLPTNLDFAVLQQVLSELGFKLSVAHTSDAA